ncbi:MAG: 16S rRNA (guanine(966)-N(2))-methyltransferase RsmD [Candidatus Eisenbacteria bacterium]
MRIIAGSRRGARLYTGKAEGFRPTSDRVREAIFAVLGEEVAGRKVLDLYAGSGALGLEALSRGASEALFVERNPVVAGWIERNGRALRLEGAIRVVRGDAVRFLGRRPEAAFHDLVFADPPYGAGLVERTLAALDALPGARRVVLERDKREIPAAARREWRKAGVYGDTVVEYLLFGEAKEVGR